MMILHFQLKDKYIHFEMFWVFDILFTKLWILDYCIVYNVSIKC